MGLFDRLFGGRFTLPPPDEPPMSDTAILRELSPVSPEQKKAMKAFTQALLARMSEAERTRLTRRVMRRFATGDGANTALVEGLLDDARGQKLDSLVLLSVDWRGFDGFAYLAPCLVKACGIEQPYEYQHDDQSSMPQVLEQFDRWLQPFGRRYVHLDSGGDSYDGIIVESGRLQELTALGQDAGVVMGLATY